MDAKGVRNTWYSYCLNTWPIKNYSLAKISPVCSFSNLFLQDFSNKNEWQSGGLLSGLVWCFKCIMESFGRWWKCFKVLEIFSRHSHFFLSIWLDFTKFSYLNSKQLVLIFLNFTQLLSLSNFIMNSNEGQAIYKQNKGQGTVWPPPISNNKWPRATFIHQLSQCLGNEANKAEMKKGDKTGESAEFSSGSPNFLISSLLATGRSQKP